MGGQRARHASQYVVLDEFHTYDGAQGTDVAMLLRRLGATLRMATPDRPLGTRHTGRDLGHARHGRRRAGRAARRSPARSSVSTSTPTRSSARPARPPTRPAPATNYRLPIPDADLGRRPRRPRRRSPPRSAPTPTTPTPVDDPFILGERLLEHPLTRAVLTDRRRPLPLLARRGRRDRRVRAPTGAEPS